MSKSVKSARKPVWICEPRVAIEIEFWRTMPRVRTETSKVKSDDVEQFTEEELLAKEDERV